MAGVNDITFKQLRALVTLARTGGVSSAADLLHLTPPAVHTQLKNLENVLGTELLNRPRSGPMDLTPSGELLVNAAKRVEAILGTAVSDIETLRTGRAGRVKLSVVSTGKYFAPALVARLKKRCETIDIDLDIGNREYTINSLREFRTQLAIMGRPPRDPLVTSSNIGPHPHVFIIAPDHPLAGIGPVPPEVLLKETFLVREQGSGTRILMSRYLDRIGEGAAYDAIEMESNETIKQAVMAGLGVALISEHTIIEELRSNRLIRLPVDGTPIVRHWFLLHPSEAPLTPAAARIKAELLAMKGDFLPRL